MLTFVSKRRLLLASYLRTRRLGLQNATEQKTGDWFSKAAVVLLKGILLFLIVNLVLYPITRPANSPKPLLTDRLRKAYPGWGKDDLLTLLRETSAADKYEYEPFTGFREVPFRGNFVNVDPAGFRLSKNQAPWPPDPTADNIFVFGGSTAFGYGVADDETIPSDLQQLATADHPSQPLAVYNFARPAYFSTQERILFEQLLNAGFVPQVAVFIDGVNDFLDAEGPLFGNKFKDFMAGKLAPATSFDSVPVVRAARWLRGRLKSPAARPPVKVDDPALLQGVVDRWLANKRMIEVIARAYGVRAIFVWQPVPTYNYDLRYHLLFHSDKGFERYAQRCKYGYPIMEKLWQQGKLGSNFLWLADLQEGKQENLYVDALHYNAAFCKEIAEPIYSFLREQEEESARRLGSHR